MEIFGCDAISLKCYKLRQMFASSFKDPWHLRISRQSQQGSLAKLHLVRSIRGSPNFLAIPIMNSLAGFMIEFILMHMYTYYHNYICVYMHACMRACSYACSYVCMHCCMYVCMHVYVYVCM